MPEVSFEQERASAPRLHDAGRRYFVKRSGKPAAAAGSFRAALRLAPAHGEWWMGLGISSEQAGDASTAATAYRQALQYPLTTALQQYVQQRLEQLAH